MNRCYDMNLFIVVMNCVGLFIIYGYIFVLITRVCFGVDVLVCFICLLLFCLFSEDA